jgi:hypothetical protein
VTGGFEPEVDLAESSPVMPCAGIEMRRDASEGMDVESLLETLDARGTGVALGERCCRDGLMADLTVVLPLTSVLSEALDGLLDFLMLKCEVLSTDERVVDLDRRVDVSDGVELPLDGDVDGIWHSKVKKQVYLGCTVGMHGYK